MTSHAARLYALAAAVLVFFVSWAAIAARPWASPAAKQDPRIAALAAREQRLRAESIAVKRILDRRWAAYRSALARRRQAAARLASAPAPRCESSPCPR